MTVLMTMTHHYVFTFLAGDSMGKIVSAVKLRISQIVLTEQRPFCISDLLEFKVGGQMHRMSYGTARNYISKLRKLGKIELGKIELAFKSRPAFYTLSGHKFDKSMILDHTGGLQHNQRYPLETNTHFQMAKEPSYTKTKPSQHQTNLSVGWHMECFLFCLSR